MQDGEGMKTLIPLDVHYYEAFHEAENLPMPSNITLLFLPP